jgi:TolB-like protein
MHRVALALAAAAVATQLVPANALAQATPDNRPGFAVFHFAYGGSFGTGAEDLTQFAVGIQQILMTELAQNTNLRVVDRARLREYMAEVDLGSRVDPATAARIGRIVGARYALTGGFVEVNGEMRIDGHIVDVETTEVLKGEEIRGRRNDIFDVLVDFASLVSRDVDLPPLPEQLREARKSRSLNGEAARLYSAALSAADSGDRERAKELYRQIASKFPEFEEARRELRQLESGQ